MIYQINKGTVFFGVNEVFQDIQFEINSNEKIAVVGRNGCGKSTLLKVIAEELELSSGSIHKANSVKIGYLAQTTFPNLEISVEDDFKEVFKDILKVQKELEAVTAELETNHSEKMLEKFADIQEKFELMGGYTYKSEMETVLTQFKFSKDDLKRKLKDFSGGQRTRLAFCKLLISKPDILLLDEPTNHLDLETIEWLEGYLKKYSKAIVLVSHDRFFIDTVCDTICEIEYGSLTRYTGNFTNFTEVKKKNQIKQQSAYNRQQKEIKQLESQIEKFRYKSSKAKFAQSKIKYLNKLERVEAVSKSDDKSFSPKFVPRVKGGKDVLITKDLEIGYDKPLANVNLKVLAHDRICIMGANGCGKSTLVKTLMNRIPQLSGEYLFGHQIEAGYFDQDLAQFSSNKTVLEEIWDDYPNLTQTEVRTLLGSFLFSSDDVFKSVNVLSGGEKVRLYFAKLVLQQPNLLILDEPTNHLDIIGKEALEDSLIDYKGTLIFVSHDRYFISKMATKVLQMKDDGIKLYEYGYSQYLENQKVNNEKMKEIKNPIKTTQSKAYLNRNQIRKVENQIEEFELIIEEKKNLRFDEKYYHDFEKMNNLNSEIEKLEYELEQAIELWEELSEE